MPLVRTTVPGSRFLVPSLPENPDSYRRSVTISDSYENKHRHGVTGTITMEEVFGGEFPYYISKFDDRAGELQSGSNLTLFRYLLPRYSINCRRSHERDRARKQPSRPWINRRCENGLDMGRITDLAGLSQQHSERPVLEERSFELHV